MDKRDSVLEGVNKGITEKERVMVSVCVCGVYTLEREESGERVKKTLRDE